MPRRESPAARPPVAAAVRVRRLAPRRRTVLELAPDLLLVFKPRGHVEEPHLHPHGQTLQVLRGCLVVEIGGRSRRLRPGTPVLRVGARTRHATRSVEDTWLVVERRRPRVRVVRERRD